MGLSAERLALNFLNYIHSLVSHITPVEWNSTLGYNAKDLQATASSVVFFLKTLVSNLRF